MSTQSLNAFLLHTPVVVKACDSVAVWWPAYRQQIAGWDSNFARAVVGGFLADRVAWAFAAGYQSALRALVPELPDDALCAICVTEQGGTSPKAMQSRLSQGTNKGWQLDGAKRWTTLGPDGGVFLVAAREADSPVDRPVIRLARVSSTLSGVELDTMPPTDFVPEVPHARLRFQGVQLGQQDVLPGDGYSDYVKPFRTIEDLHVHAAALAYLIRESRRLRWDRSWTEKAVALIDAYAQLSSEPPNAAETHLALAGAMAFGESLCAEADQQFATSEDKLATERWARDRKLLAVAGKAREIRITKAWSSLS